MGTFAVVKDNEQQVRDLIADYRDAVSRGDDSAAELAKAGIAAACYEKVGEAARARFKHVPASEDVEAIGQLIFFEQLPSHIEKFDPTRLGRLSGGDQATFAGWVLYACPTWAAGVRTELADDKAGLNNADQQMVRIYHGCLDDFRAEHGRDWDIEEAMKFIEKYMVADRRDKIATKFPDLSEAEVSEKARQRMIRDGHARTLRELRELVTIAHSSKTVSLEACLDAAGDAAFFDDGTRTASDEMVGAQALERVISVAFDDEAAERTPSVVAEVLCDPVAHFVSFASIADQFVTTGAPERQSSRGIAQQLVAAARLR